MLSVKQVIRFVKDVAKNVQQEIWHTIRKGCPFNADFKEIYHIDIRVHWANFKKLLLL